MPGFIFFLGGKDTRTATNHHKERLSHLESHFPNGFFHLEQLVLTVHLPHGQRRLRPLSAWGCITSTQTVAMTDRPRDPPRGRQVGPSPHHIHSNIERQCPLTANSEAPTLHRWDTLGYNVHSERLQIFFFFRVQGKGFKAKQNTTAARVGFKLFLLQNTSWLQRCVSVWK